MFRDCHFRPRNHCRKILINREIKIDSLSIQANCNCSNIICSVILALSVYTLATLRDGHYFIDEGGGGGEAVGKLQKKILHRKNRGKILDKGAHWHAKEICGMDRKIYFVQLEVAKILLLREIANPSPLIYPFI